MSSKSDNLLLVVAIIMVVISAIGLVATYSGMFAIEKIMLGPTAQGTTRVEIAQQISIKLMTGVKTTPALIDWQSGSVNDLFPTANLTTGSAPAYGETWGVGTGWLRTPSAGAQTSGFIIENDGNINADIYLATGNSSWEFICCKGVTGATCPGASAAKCTATGLYAANYTLNWTQNELTSCTYPNPDLSNSITPTNTWTEARKKVLTTDIGLLSCCDLKASPDTIDEIRVDVKLIIPKDAQIGVRSDFIFVTAQAWGGSVNCGP